MRSQKVQICGHGLLSPWTDPAGVVVFECFRATPGGKTDWEDGIL